MRRLINKHPLAVLFLGLLPIYGAGLAASLLPQPWQTVGVITVLCCSFLWGAFIGALAND